MNDFKRFGFDILSSQSELENYLNNLGEENVELRYPAHTSMDGTQSVIMRISQEGWHCKLLVPYFRMRSHIQTERVKRTQTIGEIVYKGIVLETGLGMKAMNIVETIPVPDSEDNTKIHLKHLVDITGFYKHPHPISKFKSGTPLWVANSLDEYIFEKETTVAGKDMYHAQRKLYVIFEKSEKQLLLN